ncbi:MAG: Gfo/Idh/MocA family oxidoreductase [Paludibacter sp.]|nr:Gfo/Idh/MocA family oxidoreductase [Paludibacter sp.]
MEKLEKVVWGIIGAGDVCEVKSAPAMSEIPHSEVKMVMRRNAAKAADFALRHGIGQWTTDLDELLNDDEINAVYIATPPDTHAALTLKCAKAGKAVYVEKPMANTYAECLTMINACQQANVPLFTAYYRRTLPGFLKVKELIENGKLGNIRFVNIEMYQPLQTEIIANLATNWRVIPEIAGGGYFHDLASHQLDYLDFLFGPITESKGISANQAGMYPADDIVTASFLFENGVLGTGMWCFTTEKVSERDSTRIVGSKGELTFNTFGSPMIIQVNTAEGGNEEFIITHTQPIQEPLIRIIVDELRGDGISPSTGISGARTTKVLDTITHPKD